MCSNSISINFRWKNNESNPNVNIPMSLFLINSLYISFNLKIFNSKFSKIVFISILNTIISLKFFFKLLTFSIFIFLCIYISNYN